MNEPTTVFSSMPQWLALPIAVLLALSTAACDGVGGANGDDPRLSPMTISFVADGGATGSLAKAAKSRAYTDADGNEITIASVEIILSELEFERADNDDACRDDDDDDCEEIEDGPLLVDLPLDGDSPEVVLEATLPEGQWEEVEFEVDKLERDDDDEAAFLDETGFPEDVSVRVTGTWTPSGGETEDFTYTSDLEEDQEIEFEPPLEVTADASNNVTFRVGVDRWFRASDDRLLNPGDDGNDDLIEENIEDSIEGFEDDDRDGDEDDDDDDDEDDDSDDDDDDDD